MKQTMFEHKIIFKNQVHELHRLYEVQKSMMKSDSRYTRRELFPMKRNFTERHRVESTRSILHESFLQKNQDVCSRYQQRSLDLRLAIGNSCNVDDLDHEEVDLSLSIGGSINKRSKISEKSWKNKVVYPSSPIIIDLEDSTGSGSNEIVKNSPNLHQGHLKMNGDMQEECNFFHSESNSRHDDKRTVLMDFDLNKEQPDESSFHSNEPLGPYPSSDGSCDESCSQITTTQTPTSKRPKDAESCSQIPTTQTPISKQPKDGESCSQIPTTQTPISKQPKDGESCSQITTSQIPKSKEPKGQTSTKDSQTKTYTIDLESLPESSSDLTEEKELIEEKEDCDYIIQDAALSLVSISQQLTSTSNQVSETKSGSNDTETVKENKKKPIKRTSSIDSYESLVLKQGDSSIDEDSATSKAFEIYEMGQKVNGIKLRRGRRMKDFQKEILPTLSSLSKDEIWEDIKILDGAIRSREYKRLNKAKSGKGENWFTPVKNKRSKVQYVSPKKKR
uniref:uncharacterized protein LOC122607760 n=1 Tax=Erigeron canadensis TaxID=72917 RepID=UPI001CB89479|nr:uncharacterized protein LOC122607760 [Erigeron canadensis]XP_043636739.1 uncharacterized protein LOC122607760 [Erigeron canadensis]